jgi:hypothetical protein
MGSRPFDGQLVRFRVPHYRVDHRAIDAGGVHSRQRFFLQKRCLAVMGRGCAFGPEVDLSVNNHHGRWLSLRDANDAAGVRRWPDGYGAGRAPSASMANASPKPL